jgi:BirA family biotin operon repressor/biotin-[acetyl-CoA-carboxylase] ligase
MTTAIRADRIRESLAASQNLERIEVFARIDSTNSFLKDQPAPAPGNFHVAIADHQTAGRGRHERKWVSAPGKSLCLSIAYTFSDSRDEIAPLTLALGVGVAEALQEIGVNGVGLKWPNDVVIGERKLGGILTEARHRGNSGITVVAGLGLNINVPAASGATVVSAWATDAIDLCAAMSDVPGPSELSERMIDALVSVCKAYDADGYEVFAERFANFDVLTGGTITLETPDGFLEGEVAGVGEGGSLLLETQSGTRTIITGSVRRIRKQRVEQ